MDLGDLEEPKRYRSLIADSDSDGLSDHVEINIYGSNPHLEDTDGDGLSDYAESNNTY